MRVGSVGAVEGVRRGAVVVVLGIGLSVGVVAAGCTSGGSAATSTTKPRPRPERTTTSREATPATTTTTAPSTTTSTTTVPPTTTTAPPGPTEITLAFAGDVLPHLPLDAQAARYGQRTGKAHDFTPLLAPMIPVVSAADVAICHMETPVAPTPARIAGYPSFGAPAELPDAIRAVGYDGCSTASNHSLDQGQAGIAATLDGFDRVGLRHAGTARSAPEAASTTVYDVHGVKVAHLSYAYGFNGYRLPAGAPWAANQIDVARIRADAHRARAAGAKLVVVSLHWGTEYDPHPDAFQRRVASQLLPSADIDLVIGHHAHVVQPIEQVGGTYVVFGLGNQLSGQRPTPRADGLTVVAHAKPQPDGRWKVVGIEAIPTYVEDGSYRVLPVVRTLQQGHPSAALAAALRASYDRTAAVLRSVPTPGITLAARP